MRAGVHLPDRDTAIFANSCKIYLMAATDITQITPAGSRLRLGALEIWRQRELLYFLTLRDIKIRYKQTLIGIAWAVLQPVLTTVIFTAIFSGWARFDTNDIAYPLFAMTGLTLWLFVQNAVSMASNSFVNNTNLVTKVYFPRLIVPLAATLAALFDLVFSIAVLAILMVYYKAVPDAAILLVPVFVVLAVLLAASVGTLLSALNVRFRDVKFAVPFFLQVWMIASPVFYPASMIPEKWRLVFAVNPMTGILEGFRSAVFGKPFDLPLIGVSVVSLFVIAAISLVVFRSMEDDFADVI
ncbi:MAG: hypothetical protein JFAIHJKO_01113 [Pyrinomonadaceae bacterium]|nr:hypothetical protein [Pyrinomonadaceae bacterium]